MNKLLPSSKYFWIGFNANKEKTKGTINARNIAIAKLILNKQGNKVVKIRKKAFYHDYNFNFGQSINAYDLLIFIQHLSLLLKSGMNLIMALNFILELTKNQKLNNILLKIKDDVSNGISFSQSISKYPNFFDPLFCSFIDFGEKSSKLEEVLSELLRYKRRTHIIKMKLKKALSYPIIVLVVGVLSIIGILIFVIPQFQLIYSDFAKDLPLLTQLVIKFSNLLQKNCFCL